MNAIVLRRTPRWPSLSAFGAALLRSQRLAVAASALYRNQSLACSSAPLRFAPERSGLENPRRDRWLA